MLVVSELLSEERQVELRGNYGGSQRLYRAGSAQPGQTCIKSTVWQKNYVNIINNLFQNCELFSLDLQPYAWVDSAFRIGGFSIRIRYPCRFIIKSEYQSPNDMSQ